MGNDTATNPPRNQCRQCWYHAYAKDAHAHLGPRENCQPCVDHMLHGHPENLIVK
ncbi:pRL2-8 [Kitasatospora purpeofusca]|uniref:pRL2-8 n=1 Tax=Kitasatospora purpeofusca TaxID=67352 RepID=UPI0035E177E0